MYDLSTVSADTREILQMCEKACRMGHNLPFMVEWERNQLKKQLRQARTDAKVAFLVGWNKTGHAAHERIGELRARRHRLLMLQKRFRSWQIATVPAIKWEI